MTENVTPGREEESPDSFRVLPLCASTSTRGVNVIRGRASVFLQISMYHVSVALASTLPLTPFIVQCAAYLPIDASLRPQFTMQTPSMFHAQLSRAMGKAANRLLSWERN